MFENKIFYPKFYESIVNRNEIFHGQLILIFDNKDLMMHYGSIFGRTSKQ